MLVKGKDVKLSQILTVVWTIDGQNSLPPCGVGVCSQSLIELHPSQVAKWCRILPIHNSVPRIGLKRRALFGDCIRKATNIMLSFVGNLGMTLWGCLQSELFLPIETNPYSLLRASKQQNTRSISLHVHGCPTSTRLPSAKTTRPASMMRPAGTSCAGLARRGLSALTGT